MADQSGVIRSSAPARCAVTGLLLLVMGCVHTAEALDTDAAVEPVPPVDSFDATTPTIPSSAGEVLGLALTTSELAPPGASLVAHVVWRHEDQGKPNSFTTRLVAELQMVELAPREPAAANPDDVEVPLVYAVQGAVEHRAVETSCGAEFGRCRVLELRDAELTGTAIRRGDVVTFELQWRRYGTEQLMSRPIAVLTDGLRTWTDSGAGEGMEAAGLAGGSLDVPISTRGRDLGYAQGNTVSAGRLDIEAR